MSIFISKFINDMADILNSKLSNKNAIYYVSLTFLFIYIFSGYLINITQYSPDSWAYFELSKTILSDNFYKFNTFRSYFSIEHSTSFPFGWPIIISLASFFISENPLNAVYINIILSISIIPIALNIGKKLDLPLISIYLICSALLLYRPYTNEVFSGRSMPLALFLFISAFYFYQKGFLFLAGIFIGTSAIVRFDFLIYALAFQLVEAATTKLKIRNTFLLLGGFLIGALPWIIYSYINFNKYWASDNSWVALSALPAFVLDYPASPVISAFDEPITWLNKFLHNLIPFLKSITESFKFLPIIVILLFFVLIKFKHLNSRDRYNFALFISGTIFCVTPYVITGYFFPRYYVLILIIGSTLLARTLNSHSNFKYIGLNINALSLFLIILTLVLGLKFLSQDISIARNSKNKTEEQIIQINNLYLCHTKNPEITYIFMNDVEKLAPQYGAITGMRAAFIPSNFNRMTISEKDNYFKFMQPYALIDNFAKIEKCKSH